MINWKSKYLAMKLKYINAKQKGGYPQGQPPPFRPRSEDNQPHPTTPSPDYQLPPSYEETNEQKIAELLPIYETIWEGINDLEAKRNSWVSELNSIAGLYAPGRDPMPGHRRTMAQLQGLIDNADKKIDNGRGEADKIRAELESLGYNGQVLDYY